MKEFIFRNRYLLLIVVLSIVPLYSLFNPTLLYTQDGYTHLIRGAAYFKAIKDFNIPPRWAGDLNYGYGMPLFVFVFQLPYQLYALLITLGFNLSTIFKILLFGSYLFSGLSMYWFCKDFFDDGKKAFLVTVLYQFFPYRFTDLTLRGSIGESFTYVFLPLVLLGVHRLSKKFNLLGFLLVIVGTSALLLSHLATGGIFILISILFVFILIPKRRILFILAAIIYGFVVSSYYVIPAVIEHKYTYGDLFAKNLYKENLVPLSKLFSPTIFNDQSIKMGDVPVNLGIIFIILFITLLIYLLTIARLKKKDRKIIIFTSIIVVGSIFMTTDLSKIIWERITLLRQFQFPWRFLAPAGFALAFFAGIFSSFLNNKKIYWVFLIATILTSTVFWEPKLGYRKMDENLMWNYPMTTTYFGETDVIWSAGPAKAFPKERVEVISGSGVITNIHNSNNSLSFKTNSDKDLGIVAHLQYFPGWKALVDNVKTTIQFQDPNNRGELVFTVPRGNHMVNLTFGEDALRLVSDLISLVSIVLLLPLIYFLKRSKRI